MAVTALKKIQEILEKIFQESENRIYNLNEIEYSIFGKDRSLWELEI